MRKEPEIECDTKGCHNTVDEDFCEVCLEKKFDEAKEEGDREGYDKGYEEGYEEAKLKFAPDIVALENMKT